MATGIPNRGLNRLHEIHPIYYDKTTSLSCSTAAAVFLCVGALIVIMCGCLCLQLPNVNVIKHVILPAIVPGFIAIGLSIPFIIKTVKGRDEIKPQRREMFEIMVAALNDNRVATMKKNERVKFILKNFLEWKDGEKEGELLKDSREASYQRGILTKLQKIMDKNKDVKKTKKTAEKILSAIGDALSLLYESGNLVKLQKRSKAKAVQ